MAVIDIACPACGDADTVRKVGIGSYRCTSCDHEFDQEALDPERQFEEGTRR